MIVLVNKIEKRRKWKAGRVERGLENEIHNIYQYSFPGPEIERKKDRSKDKDEKNKKASICILENIGKKFVYTVM